MNQNNLTFKPHPQFSERAKEFYEAYELVGLIANDDDKFSKRSLKQATDRQCLFCGKKYGETVFSNYSHLIPRLIGNRNLYSEFECDVCNKDFSTIENDLAEFLGVSRSFSGMADEKMTLGFKAKRLHTKSRSFLGNNILIIAPQDVKKIGDITTIPYEKNPFVPANVYKALLKSSLSLLGEETVKSNYERALSYLSGKSVIREGALIAGYKLSFTVNLPLHIFIFRKRRKEDNIFTHLVTFNFQNSIISVPIPLHSDDFLHNHQEMNSPLAPPYFANEKYFEFAKPAPFLRDMSSIVKLEGEQEDINLVFDSSNLKQMASYNHETGETKRQIHGPDNIKYLIMTKEGASFDIKELSEFIRSQTEKD